jgi:Intracellular proteinase inhibitor
LLRRRVIINKKKQLLTFAVTLVVIVGAFFAILNHFVALQQPPTSSAEHTVGPLRYSLDMPRSDFRENEDVVVRLTVKNTGASDIKLVFTHELEFDLIVQKEVNLIFATVPLDLWIYSSCHQNLPKAHVVTLRSRESKSYEARWPQVNSKGDKVSPGRYTLTGILDLDGHRQALTLRGAAH